MLAGRFAPTVHAMYEAHEAKTSSTGNRLQHYLAVLASCMRALQSAPDTATVVRKNARHHNAVLLHLLWVCRPGVRNQI